MSWLQISINTTKDHAERAEDCLFAVGAQTVTLTDAADQPILEPGVDEVPIWNAVVVTGLFSDDQYNDENKQKQLLEHIDASLPGIEHSCDIEILEDRNWTRAWMDNYHAMQFGERLWVVPLHIDPPDANAVNLRLDPGLAFGTGTHPTTSLCLRWLDKNIRQQETLLDFQRLQLLRIVVKEQKELFTRGHEIVPDAFPQVSAMLLQFPDFLAQPLDYLGGRPRQS